MLVERRRALLREIQSRVRDVREVGSSTIHHNTDPAEPAEAEPEDDLAFALIQMKGEMLQRIDEAVLRVDEGTYGCCIDCGEAIGSARLRALPFAVSCRDCEETRERERPRKRVPLLRVPSGLGSRY
jgi:DnaK suppressor protein